MGIKAQLKGFLYIILAITLAVAVGLSIAMILIVSHMGVGVKTTDKTEFSGAKKYIGEIFVLPPYVVFEGVNMKSLSGNIIKKDVLAYVDVKNDGWMEVSIDTELESSKETKITVIPDISSMMFMPLLSVKSEKVIVWVGNPRDKAVWENWKKSAREHAAEIIRNKKVTQGQYVLPK